MNVVLRAWSEAETADALRLWKEGHTASEIAARLGTNRSRNSVIGLVHRKGANRNSPPRRTPVVKIRTRSARQLSSDRARMMAVTRWKSSPPKPKPPQSVSIDPASPAAQYAAALLASARAAEARRAMYRADAWGRTL